MVLLPTDRGGPWGRIQGLLSAGAGPRHKGTREDLVARNYSPEPSLCSSQGLSACLFVPTSTIVVRALGNPGPPAWPRLTERHLHAFRRGLENVNCQMAFGRGGRRGVSLLGHAWYVQVSVRGYRRRLLVRA